MGCDFIYRREPGNICTRGCILYNCKLNLSIVIILTLFTLESIFTLSVTKVEMVPYIYMKFKLIFLLVPELFLTGLV